MKKVLLTGATGLIGQYILEPLLNAGFEVFAISTKQQKYIKGVNWIQLNLLEIEKIENAIKNINAEYLIHLAWDTTPGVYLESEDNYKWVKSSLELLKQFKNQGGKRAVFAGTCFEYEFQDEPLSETETKINPKSIYAKCKNELNMAASDFAKNNDISFAWGRIFYVYGANEQKERLFPYIIENLISDKEVIIATGDLLKDYMFADDTAEAFVKLLESKVTGCVNICSGKALSIKEIALTIAKKLNKANLIKFENKQTSQAPMIIGDNTRLTNEVKYFPKHSINSGIDELLNIYLS